MPILELNLKTNKLTQECANCHRSNVVDVSKLVLGIAIDAAKKNPDMILLPACACGSREGLSRTWDRCPDSATGSRFDEHRRTVNALAQHLLHKKQSNPALADEHKKEGKPPPDMNPGVVFRVASIQAQSMDVSAPAERS